MKTGFLMRGLLAFAFTVLLFPLITFGETSPFTLNVTLLKDHVPGGELVPISVTFTLYLFQLPSQLPPTIIFTKTKLR